MPEQPSAGVGEHVAQQRKLNGLTQAQLARRAHVSLSLVRKVEQGSAPASPAFVSATARALGVGVAELLGQPIRPTDPAEHQVFAVIPPLRRELAAYRLPPDDEVIARGLNELRSEVEHASLMRHSVDLTTLGTELPGLLAELRAAVHTTTGTEQERAFGLLAEARGYLLHGDRENALSSLMTARRTAPQQTRYHPMVAETVRTLARADRRSSDTLSGFATWMGIGA